MPDAVVVDDDTQQLAGLAELVALEGFDTRTARSVEDARALLAARRTDIVLSDLMLPDGRGTDLLDDLGDAARLVLVTGHATVESAVDALRRGATDYLLKPVDPESLRAMLRRVTQPKAPRASADGPVRRHFDRLVGESDLMRQVYVEIARVASTDASVLVVGESGTGKDLVAQSIHDLSKRAARPFLAINCGAMSATLIESELFGHERGSFTGAAQRHQGHFERATGGTLFLDEITEMPVELQARLLRVLETGILLRVGGEVPLQTDVRIVAATNCPPETAIREGKLRNDLYYRLSVFPIHLPQLRRRRGDVPLLARHFLTLLNDEEGSRKQFHPEVLAALDRYEWPGNVRQLRNVIQRAFILSGDDRELRHLPRFDPVHPPELGTPIVVGRSLEDLKREVILATLAHYRNRRKAAAALGISLKTLYNRLNLYRRMHDRGTPEADE